MVRSKASTVVKIKKLDLDEPGKLPTTSLPVETQKEF